MPPAASPGSPEADRIRGYLQAQAAKLSIPDLTGKVRDDMQQFREALSAVPPERFTERPSDGDWSANEIASHLLETSRSVSQGICSVLDSGSLPPAIADQMRRTGDVRDADEWWDLLLSDREATLARVNRATGNEHLDVKWPHGVFGDLNWREWLLFMRVHDLDHARQLQSVTDSFTR